MKFLEWIDGVFSAIAGYNWRYGLNHGQELAKRHDRFMLAFQRPITVQEISEQLPEVTERQIRYDCETGELPAWKHGSVWAVWEEDAQRYIGRKLENNGD